MYNNTLKVFYLLGNADDNEYMKIRPLKEIRLENARRLQETVGGQKVICEKLGKQQSQVSAFMGTNPTKGIGDKVARQLESAFGLQRGWLDTQHTDAEEPAPVTLSESDQTDTVAKPTRWLDLPCLAQCIYAIETILELEPERSRISVVQRSNMIAGLYATRLRHDGKPTPGDAEAAIMTVLVGNGH